MALIRLTFLLLLATFISGNALAASRGIANPALFPNRVVAQDGEPVDFSGPLITLNMDAGGWDCSGNRFHADMNGTTAAIEGVVTNGFKISSTTGNNFLVISNAPINMSVTQSCTMLIWFKPAAENNETPVDGHLIHLTDNCSFPQFMLTYNPESTPGGAVEASFLGTGLAHPDESLDTNTWVCAGVTWNHLTSELVVWRDGIPSEAAVISEPPGEGSFFNLSLGGSCTPFDSVVQIDEFKVWDRVLSSNTIAYIAGHPAETVIACEVPGSAQLFYSDFENQTDDDKWSGAAWNLDYTTSPAPLEGAESGQTTANGTMVATLDAADSDGTTYARMAFRSIGNGTSAGAAISLTLRDGAGTLVCASRIWWNNTSGVFYRLYAVDSDSDSNASPGSPVAFQDATYYLYLTYNRGVSVVAEVKDSGGNLIAGYTRTLSTTDSLTVEQVAVTQGVSSAFVFDEVEVRKDTNWGTR